MGEIELSRLAVVKDQLHLIEEIIMQQIEGE